MKVAIRPLISTDLHGIDRLRTQVYSQSPRIVDADWQASVWRWLETHPLAGDMRRWVVVAGDEVVGHLAALPQYYRINGQRVVAHTPADYAVLPQYSRHAILLMRKFFSTAVNCVSCAVIPAVITIQGRLGSEEAGKLQFAAKLLNVSAIPNFPTAIPVPIPQLINRGLWAVDRVLSDPLVADDPRVEVYDGFDESFDELFESVAAATPCVPEKDAAFLRWRYGPGSPQASATLLGARSEGRLLGYAVLWVSPRGDGYLLDLTTRPGHHDVARSLLRQTVRHFRRAKVRSIRHLFIPSPTSAQTKDLWRLGVLPVNKRRPVLLVRFADRSLHKVARDIANWSYSTGDGEATFWAR
jgi:Acetyltransferase (GNAT) domain